MLAYFVLGDADQGRANVRDYYKNGGPETVASIEEGLLADAASGRDTVALYAGLGADELIFSPALDSVDEVGRLADIVF